jgi:hypothetical protein
MALSIKADEADKLARALAQLTGRAAGGARATPT